MADRFTFAVSIPTSVIKTIIEFKSFRKLSESFHIDIFIFTVTSGHRSRICNRKRSENVNNISGARRP